MVLFEHIDNFVFFSFDVTTNNIVKLHACMFALRKKYTAAFVSIYKHCYKITESFGNVAGTVTFVYKVNTAKYKKDMKITESNIY